MGGLQISNRIGNGGRSGGFAWASSQAKDYYDALATANGGDIDSLSLYSISLNDLKTGIDNLFSNSSAYIARQKQFFPFVGGTGATHAINGFNALSELTYVGSPTHSALGLITNGSTQYADTGKTPNSLGYANNSGGLACYGNYLGTSFSHGVLSSGASYTTIRKTNLTSVQLIYSSAVANGVVSNTVPSGAFMNSVWIGSVHSGGDLELFIDDVSQGTAAGGVGTLPVHNTFIGALNNKGTAIILSQGDTRFFSSFDGLTDAECSNFHDNIVAFNTLLGR